MSKYNLDHFVDTKNEPVFVVTMLLFFAAICYAVFSFIIIYKARRYMLQQKSVPKSFGNILNESGAAMP
uniref:Uncharacterized protein n=1 Tax=Panagrolaimus sp. ES5 TaxID=591445 RepID=A0AC34FY54_9BILA